MRTSSLLKLCLGLSCNRSNLSTVPLSFLPPDNGDRHVVSVSPGIWSGYTEQFSQLDLVSTAKGIPDQMRAEIVVFKGPVTFCFHILLELTLYSLRSRRYRYQIWQVCPRYFTLQSRKMAADQGDYLLVAKK